MCSQKSVASVLSTLVSLAGNDPEGHLLGAQILLNAQKYTEMSSGLRQGAFWVALRQVRIGSLARDMKR